MNGLALLGSRSGRRQREHRQHQSGRSSDQNQGHRLEPPAHALACAYGAGSFAWWRRLKLQSLLPTKFTGVAARTAAA